MQNENTVQEGEAIRIRNTSIYPGEHVQISLEIAKLPSRTPIEIPIYIYRAKEPGPALLLTAGMHGDEINGVEIVRQMIANKLTIPKRGSVIAIPLLNVYGFLNFSREVPDGKDINRSFPGSPTGSLASRVAHAFSEEVLPIIDLGIDFHTGGGSINNYSQIRCVFGEGNNDELARVFAPSFIINAKLRERSLRHTATKMGKSILVYEGGEALRLSRSPVRDAIRGTLRLMHHLDMIDREDLREMPDTFNQIEPIYIQRSRWIRAKAAGIFRTYARNGSFIEKGQILATITDPFGEFKVNVKATEDAYIVAVNHHPVVNQGDALFHIGFTHE
ncbi:MAG: succinylglutamate desuccinylase/aspartoacylase family protein [Bernardetiaceae bacterium]|nr:succinylglutamate desuccinylase/aspartoacylase family protein [Bernardetiaceae bacterium]